MKTYLVGGAVRDKLMGYTPIERDWVVVGARPEDLEKAFIAEAAANGLGGLKGHRSVGGCRASIYNAASLDTVKALTDFMIVMKYSANENAARTSLEGAERVKLSKGKYAGVVFSPLEKTRIDPDLVMIFCNPAQLMRLVHGATQEAGGAVQSMFSGRAGTCTEGVLQTLKTGEPKVVLPGNGDRVWAMVQDDEIAFAIPSNWLDPVIHGLEATHQTGVRYPIPVDIRHEPTFPGQLKDAASKAGK